MIDFSYNEARKQPVVQAPEDPNTLTMPNGLEDGAQVSILNGVL